MPILLKPETREEGEEMAVVALRDTVIFPDSELPITFGRPESVKAVLEAYQKNEEVFLVAQKNPRLNKPGWKGIYEVGTITKLENVIQAEGALYGIARGLKRAKIIKPLGEKPFLKAMVAELAEEKIDDEKQLQILGNLLINQLRRALSLGKGFDPRFLEHLSGANPRQLSYQLASLLDLDPSQKQALLEENNLRKRLEKIAEYLAQEIKVLELERQIDSKTQDSFDRSMRETVLRQRREMIDRELGKLGAQEEDPEIRKLREKIKKAGMPRPVQKKAEEELNRFAKMSPMNPESGYLRTYLDWLTSLPWENQKSPNNVSLKKAAKILDEDHYGLKEVKERILEYLAVMQLREKNKEESGKKKRSNFPTILCFIGPPGVGKTSVGKSIARALGRKFVRISLGGIRDEAEIRGHRRTYVGALPGRIIQGMKEAGTKNPVFMLDEIDKVGTDFRGDPASALLEALDPEQNKEFSDHYLEVPYDLSEVFFIATGNVLDNILPPLRDRMEIIHFPGYTDEEKYFIAKRYLWPKQLEANSLEKEGITITPAALYKIIRSYTREAGVRQLERELSRIARKKARQVAEGKKVEKKITPAQLHSLLGPVEFSSLAAETKEEVGRATGLAWTQAGGEILFIEVALMPGRGQILLTGHLGEVMKESCQAAISYVRSHWERWGLKKDFNKNLDIHVHVPEGAVPKDGPSAGVAIATAVVSALTGKPVKSEVGMTGEITLRGKVLEIGGVKEKVLAAHRAGLKKVILPKDNKKNLEDIPAKIRKEMKFVFAENLDEVFKEALVENKKRKN
jgi:ATP-dependent Lon protease